VGFEMRPSLGPPWQKRLPKLRRACNRGRKRKTKYGSSIRTFAKLARSRGEYLTAVTDCQNSSQVQQLCVRAQLSAK